MQHENYRKKDCVKVDQRLHVGDATSSCLHLQLKHSHNVSVYSQHQ